MKEQDPEFDQVIGTLDFVLSKLVGYAKAFPGQVSKPNQQTLKHHAEDMIAAGECILKNLGKGVKGTPQPEAEATTPPPPPILQINSEVILMVHRDGTTRNGYIHSISPTCRTGEAEVIVKFHPQPPTGVVGVINKEAFLRP